MSYALHDAAASVFPDAALQMLSDKKLTSLGYSLSPLPSDTAAATGKAAALAVINSRIGDKSNQENEYEDTTGYEPRNPAAVVFDPTYRNQVPYPSLWQP